jgi:hypothetical protein
MSTWHQDNGGRIPAAYSPDRVMWKLVENPSNELCTVGIYETREEAEAYIERRVERFKNGRREHFTIVAPQKELLK